MKNKLNFDRLITKKDLKNDGAENKAMIFVLECGHIHMIRDPILFTRTKFFCSQCVSEFLIKENKAINEYFKNPVTKPLKLKD